MADGHRDARADGRAGPTLLVRRIAEHFGRATVQEVIEDLHLARLDPAALGGLAPLVLQAESVDGDATAVGLVRRQAEEVVVLAVVALRRLDLLDAPATVVLGGGVLTSGDPLLLAEVDAGLQAAAPRARRRVTEAAPVVGAALLGLDRRQANPEAAERLRESLRAARSAGQASRDLTG